MRAKADDSPTNFVNALGNTHRHTHTQTQNTVESIQLRCSCRSLGWNRPVLVCRAGIRNDHHRRWRYKHENSISSDDSHVPACRHHCPICHGLTSFHFRWATRGGIRRFPELPTIRRWHDARQLVQEGWASRAGCAILCGSRICFTLLSYPLHHGDPPISRWKTQLALTLRPESSHELRPAWLPFAFVADGPKCFSGTFTTVQSF